jgi:hypothetical protein
MKTFLLYAVLLTGLSLGSGCSDKDEPTPRRGCATGINDAGVRVLIVCCTKEQFIDGGNIKDPVTGESVLDDYTHTSWSFCDDCK